MSASKPCNCFILFFPQTMQLNKTNNKKSGTVCSHTQEEIIPEKNKGGVSSWSGPPKKTILKKMLADTPPFCLP